MSKDQMSKINKADVQTSEILYSLGVEQKCVEEETVWSDLNHLEKKKKH